MENNTIAEPKSTKLLANLPEKLINFQNEILYLFDVKNIVLFVIVFSAVIFGLIILCYLVLYVMHKIQIFFDKQDKKTCFLEVYFDQYTDYGDAKFMQIMDNLFKRLDQIIRNSNQIVSFEIHKFKKENGTCSNIKFVVSASKNDVLISIKSLIVGIDGAKIKHLQLSEKNNYEIPKPFKIKKVVYKNIISPIYFKSSNIFADIIKDLNSSQYCESGCVILFRSSNTKKEFQNKKRRANTLAKNPKRHDQHYQEGKSNLIIEKTNHGELFQVKIYVYGQNNTEINALASSFASSSLNNDVQTRNIPKSEKHNLNNRYLPPEFKPLRSLNGYSILNSFELSHIIGPVYSILQGKINPNIIKIPTYSSENNTYKDKSLLLLNDSGDTITEADAFLNIIAFGDPNSGKTSGFIGNIVKSYFLKNYGMFFTVFKAEDVPTVIELAEKENRLRDLILINKNSNWRTNIINTELNSTGSIKNAINLFEKINKITHGKPVNENGTDPFWENASKNLFANLLKITISFHGKFSMVVFEQISQLASEYARSITGGFEGANENNEKLIKIQNEKRNEFENIINSITKNVNEKTSPIFNDREEINKCLTYFTIDWVNMPRKTRESVYSVFRSNIDSLNSGFIAKFLLSDLDQGSSDYFEFSDTRNGKIIILDLPISKEKEEARIFQEVAKSFWQREMIRNESGNPCVLVSDEFQQFGGDSDADFLSVNRSYRIANIFATQNYTSLVDKLGEIKTKKMLGNIQTKFFFQTSDKNTWQYAREIMGEVVSNSYSQNYNQNQSSSISSNQKFELLGQHFQQLGMTTPRHQAEAIVFKKGYLFNENKKKYLNVIFNKVEKVQVRKVEKENVAEVNKNTNLITRKFINISESINRYKKSESLIRKKISGLNLEIKLEKQENGKTQKLYSQEQLDKIFNR